MNPFARLSSKSVRYEKLSTDDLDPRERVRTRRSDACYWAVHLIFPLCGTLFLVLGSLAFYAAGLRDCIAPSDWSNPGFDHFLRRNVKFVGSFESVSPYRGPPSPEVDAAWARYTVNPWIDGTAVVLGVGPKEVEHAKKNTADEWFNSTVQLGNENGGGMMATLEMFHQLHCLDLVRKFTHHKYPYYKTTGGVFDRPLEFQQNHIDHCIEIIRQVIMCNADTGLITFHWTENNPVAYPDFNTWHTCRDPEEVLALAKNQEAPMKQHVKKTEGIITMPTPP